MILITLRKESGFGTHLLGMLRIAKTIDHQIGWVHLLLLFHNL
jgi:hypothetical protein